MSRTLRPAWPLLFGALFAAAFGGGHPASVSVGHLFAPSLDAARSAAALAPAPTVLLPAAEAETDGPTRGFSAGYGSLGGSSGPSHQGAEARPGRADPPRPTFLRARYTTGPPTRP